MRQKQLVVGMAIILIMALLIMGLFSPERATMTGFATLSTDRSMENTTSVYSVVPITRVGMDYSLDEYEKIVSAARKLVMSCRGKEEIYACIQDKIGDGWNVDGNEGNFYFFYVAGNQKHRQYYPINNGVADTQIFYYFALDFS